MSDRESKIDLDTYRAELTHSLLTELFALIGKDRKEHGDEFANELLLGLISSMISTMLFQSMKRVQGVPPYAAMKEALENAVAAAFTGAFLNVSTDPIAEFLCQVKRVSPPPSKLFN